MKKINFITLFPLLLLTIIHSQISISSHKIVFSGFTPEDLDNGYKTANFTYTYPITINIQSQDRWIIYIQSDDIIANSSINSFPVQNIEWKHAQSSDNDFKPLSINKQIVANSNSFPNNIQLNFRVKANWLTPPGQYFFPINIYLEESRNFLDRKKRIRKKFN